MELVYAGLLLHSVGKKITEENVKKVLEGAGAKVDQARVKALVSALDGVNIEEVIQQTATPTVIASATTKEEKVEVKEEKAEEKEEEKEAEAASGLASLFG